MINNLLYETNVKTFRADKILAFKKQQRLTAILLSEYLIFEEEKSIGAIVS